MKTGLAILASTLFLAEARNLAVNDYCDEWNKCSSDLQCVNKKCVPLTCTESANCAEGFECKDGKCISTTPIGDNGRYCDEWTPCQKDHKCAFNKCVPLACTYSTDCATDYMCYAGQCISGSWSGQEGGYCDAWTKCNAKDQCVNRKCVPFVCTRTPDCAFGYTCYQGSCIQINNNHTRGRYCDAQNECDILHQCVDSQCVWK